MRTLVGLTVGSAFSGLLIGSWLLAGPAPQPTARILLSQVIESNPTPPREQKPMRPLEEMPKPPMEQKPMRPLEEMPKPPTEQNPTPPVEKPSSSRGEQDSVPPNGNLPGTAFVGLGLESHG
jgi:outer membrane biosynthesis protein TonB